MSILDRFLAEKRENTPIVKKDVTANKQAMHRIATLPPEVKQQWVTNYLAAYNQAVPVKGKAEADALACRLAWCKVPQQYKQAAILHDCACPKCGKPKEAKAIVCPDCLGKDFPDKA